MQRLQEKLFAKLCNSRYYKIARMRLTSKMRENFNIFQNLASK